MSTFGDSSALGDVQYNGGYHYASDKQGRREPARALE